MEITFHLNTGGTVTLDLEKVSEAHAAEHQNGWLWDKHGAGVDLSAVIGIVPGKTVSGDPIYPDMIVDGDGDEWTHVGDGIYILTVYNGTITSRTTRETYTRIKEQYGIQEHGA